MQESVPGAGRPEEPPGAAGKSDQPGGSPSPAAGTFVRPIQPADTAVRPIQPDPAGTAVRPIQSDLAGTAVRPIQSDLGATARPSAGARTNADPAIAANTGPPVAPTAPGWTGGHRPVPAGRNRGRRVPGVVITVLIAAAVAGYLVYRSGDGLSVAGASVAPVGGARQSCDTTVDVVGTVRTNGQAGDLAYRWSRSDGGGSEVVTQPVPAGTTSVEVHLLWTVAGKGGFPATATLRVLAPNPVEARGEFRYDCP